MARAGGGEEVEVVSLYVLFDVLHPKGRPFPFWHTPSALSDVKKKAETYVEWYRSQYLLKLKGYNKDFLN